MPRNIPHINQKNIAYHGSPIVGIEREGFKLQYLYRNYLGFYFRTNLANTEQYRHAKFDQAPCTYTGKDGKPGQVYEVKLPGLKHLVSHFEPISLQPSARARKILSEIIAEHEFEPTLSDELCGGDVIALLRIQFEREHYMDSPEALAATRTYLTNKGLFGSVTLDRSRTNPAKRDHIFRLC